jgi:hypothetical protein
MAACTGPQRNTHNKVVRYEINKLTMQFVDKEANAEFNDYLLNKAVDHFSFTFLLVYNVLTGPAFLYSNLYIDPKPLSGHFGRLGQWFVCIISQLHVLFFVLFFMEKLGFSWLLSHWGCEHARTVQRMRMVLITVYVLLVPCGTGLAMLVKIRHLCSPEQLSIHEIYICSTSSPGAIPVDAFCVGSAIIIFLQFAFPTPWPVVVVSWLLQLAALLLSAYEFTTPQTTVSNTTLIVFQLLSVGLHGVIHWNSMQAFVREQLDTETNTNTSASASLSQSQDVDDDGAVRGGGGGGGDVMTGDDVIAEYLAGLYRRQQSGSGQRGDADVADGDDDDKSVGSSVSISEYSCDDAAGGKEDGERREKPPTSISASSSPGPGPGLD